MLLLLLFIVESFAQCNCLCMCEVFNVNTNRIETSIDYTTDTYTNLTSTTLSPGICEVLNIPSSKVTIITVLLLVFIINLCFSCRDMHRHGF